MISYRSLLLSTIVLNDNIVSLHSMPKGQCHKVNAIEKNIYYQDTLPFMTVCVLA